MRLFAWPCGAHPPRPACLEQTHSVREFGDHSGPAVDAHFDHNDAQISLHRIRTDVHVFGQFFACEAGSIPSSASRSRPVRLYCAATS